MTKYLGIDASITCTGLAGNQWTDTIRPNKKAGIHTRMDEVVTVICDRYLAGVDLVVIEGISFGSPDTNRQIAGLNWIIRRELWKRDVPFASVPPASLKQLMTGKGNASKADVVREVTRRCPWFDGGEDESDAVACAALAAERLGLPLVSVPKAWRDAAMAKVQWPDLPAFEVAA